MAQRSRETAIFVAYEEEGEHDAARPEKELLRAILQNALSDVKKPGELGRRAREYFLNSSDEYIFSFQSVCAYLNVSPRKILTVAGLVNPTASVAGASMPDENKNQDGQTPNPEAP